MFVLALFGLPSLWIFLLVASLAHPVGGNAGGAGAIPATALAAYAAASAGVGGVVAGCVVPPAVLMAVGKVESDHAGGRPIRSDGAVDPPIVGPALDGVVPDTEKVADTDGGRLDGDPVWDHAVGPMQVLPSTWASRGRDGSGDGVADPQNYFDAALTAAVILCRPPADLSDPTRLAAALHGYNNSDGYVASVQSWAEVYEGPTAARSTAARIHPSSSARKAGSMLWLIGDSR